MDLNLLPKEIMSKILLYLECPIAKLIKNEIKYYEEDHNWGLTKTYRMYYVKNIFDFSNYYFDRLYEPYEYSSYFERKNDEYYKNNMNDEY